LLYPPSGVQLGIQGVVWQEKPKGAVIAQHTMNLREHRERAITG
jgi:hypothetical protein